MRRFHTWAGLLAGPLVLVAAGTALALNHRDLLARPVSERVASPYARYLTAVAAPAVPDAPGLRLVGTSDGVFRTTDGGRTFEEVTLPVPAEQVVALASAPDAPATVYLALRESGVWRSDDGGWVWEEVALPFTPAFGGETIQALAPGPKGALALLTPAGLRERAPAGGWTLAPRPAAPAAEGDKALVRLAYDLHDGRFWGRWGVWLTDAAAALLLALVATGYGMALRAWALRRRAVRRRAG